MLPDFDKNGNLPPGTHHASFDEILNRFGGKTYHPRRQLANTLSRILQEIEGYAVGIYINGSFTTVKFAPSDIDLLVLLSEDFAFDSSNARRILWWRRNKEQFNMDIFAYAVNRNQEEINEMLNAWTIDKDGNSKGIVYLEIDHD